MKYNEYVIIGESGTSNDVKDSGRSDNISPRALEGKTHNFAMHTFNKPTRCSCCKSLLNGTFYQGYLCSDTGIQCHKSCLSDALKAASSDQGPASPVSRNPSRTFGSGVIRKGVPPPVPTRELHSLSIHGSSVNYKAHRDYNGVPPPPYPNVPIIKFQIGQPVEVTQQVSNEWWMGRSLSEYEKIGFFPASHVSPINPKSRREEKFDTPKSCPSSHEQLKNYYWYAGEIDRGTSEGHLLDKPTGTFLVRKKSPKDLVVSLKFQNDVKHIRVHQTEDNLHYVAECKNFRSVQELIRFYENNSLSGFFLGLETTLKFPYRNPEMFPDRTTVNGTWDQKTGKMYNLIGKAKAKFDFDARSEQELSLTAGQSVNIISKAGGDHGWWKGEYDGRVGYFPTSFVDEIN